MQRRKIKEEKSSKKNIDPKTGSSYLEEAAKLLIERFESPAQLLDFLIDSLHWVHKSQVDKNDHSEHDDHHFSIIVIIEELVMLWMKDPKNPLDQVFEGVENLNSFCGGQGLQDCVHSILTCFADNMQALHYDLDFADKRMLQINTFYRIGILLSRHNYEQQKDSTNLKAA